MAGIAFDIHGLSRLRLGPLLLELSKHIVIEVWLIKRYEIAMDLSVSSHFLIHDVVGIVRTQISDDLVRYEIGRPLLHLVEIDRLLQLDCILIMDHSVFNVTCSLHDLPIFLSFELEPSPQPGWLPPNSLDFVKLFP